MMTTLSWGVIGLSSTATVKYISSQDDYLQRPDTVRLSPVRSDRLPLPRQALRARGVHARRVAAGDGDRGTRPDGRGVRQRTEGQEMREKDPEAIYADGPVAHDEPVGAG